MGSGMRWWLRIPQIVLLAVGFAAAVVAKGQSGDGGDPAGWLLATFMAAFVAAEILELVERRHRRRVEAPREDYKLATPEPFGGPPGWRWDPVRTTWREPDPRSPFYFPENQTGPEPAADDGPDVGRWHLAAKRSNEGRARRAGDGAWTEPDASDGANAWQPLWPTGRNDATTRR